ncbi:hypothetical protein [Paenibacillus anaericanus]|nr:hypothetical protein [Paenibacillus anaericanus]
MLLILLFLFINVGFWIEMKYIMEVGTRERIITLIFTNIFLMIAAIFQSRTIAYIVLGIGLVISIVFSVVKELKK